MLNSLLHLAESEPIVHISPLPVFTINGITVTNSMLFAWLTSFILIILFIFVGRRATLRPKGGFTQVMELGSEFITGTLENSFGNRAMAVKYAPFFVTMFFFIAFSNIFGLLPGVGEALTYHDAPLLRAFTADLNGTLAAAAVAMIMIQYYAIKESGFVKHLRHYFGGSLKNPLTYLAGLYEVLNELVRVFSLALRLFLNIAIGEIIISVFAFLGRTIAPLTALPFLLLELGVCLLQAYIFVMLSTTYLSLAVKHGDEHEAEDSADTPPQLIAKGQKA